MNPVPNLTTTENQGRSYRAFRETACWTVNVGTEEIGQVWRAERDDGVKCWMQHPSVLGFSLPASAVIAGYSRTTKKRAAADVFDWHRLGGLSIISGDWTLHCHRAFKFGDRDEHGYLALHGDGRSRWVSLYHNETEKPHMGMMGSPGWHAVGTRGHRMVTVHQASDAQEAVEILLPCIGQEPSPEDKRPLLPLPCERHFGSLAGLAVTPVPV